MRARNEEYVRWVLNASRFPKPGSMKLMLRAPGASQWSRETKETCQRSSGCIGNFVRAAIGTAWHLLSANLQPFLEVMNLCSLVFEVVVLWMAEDEIEERETRLHEFKSVRATIRKFSLPRAQYIALYVK